MSSKRKQSRFARRPLVTTGNAFSLGRLAATAVALATAAIAALAMPVSANDGVDYWLTVFHNNDGESALLPSPAMEGGTLGLEGGVAFFASVLRDARAAANVKPAGDNTKRASIFVSSGDNFLAGPAFTASLADGVFYDAVALNRLKYDAIDLGNHDFDFGPDVLAQFISQGFANPGKPPYLNANLDVSAEPALQAIVVISHLQGIDEDLALASLVDGGLGGLISFADYPEGGAGRITRHN